MTKKIYLAGKVTGLSRIEASQKFGAMEKQLREEGYEVINPLNLVDFHDTWKNAMRICINALLDCDEAYFMDCWRQSKGAIIERSLAKHGGIPLHPKSF
jgi:hypothetical protein